MCRKHTFLYKYKEYNSKFNGTFFFSAGAITGRMKISIVFMAADFSI